MPATLLDTPCGLFPIREYIVKRHAAMTDLEIADETFKSQPGFINPEAFAELEHRRLIYRGDHEEDVYRRIDDALNSKKTLRKIAREYVGPAAKEAAQ